MSESWLYKRVGLWTRAPNFQFDCGRPRIVNAGGLGVPPPAKGVSGVRGEAPGEKNHTYCCFIVILVVHRHEIGPQTVQNPSTFCNFVHMWTDPSTLRPVDAHTMFGVTKNVDKKSVHSFRGRPVDARALERLL